VSRRHNLDEGMASVLREAARVDIPDWMAAPHRARSFGRSANVYRRSAFTLIEVLLAVTLTAVLMTMTGRIAVNSAMSASDVEDVVRRIEWEARLFDLLASDVADIIPRHQGDGPSLKVFGTRRQTLELYVLSGVATIEGSIHLARHPMRVRYRLSDESRQDGGYDLVRETVDYTLPGTPPLREIVASGLAELSLEVYRGDQWTTSFAPNKKSESLLRAVRISIRWLGSKSAVSRVFMIRDVE